MAADQNTKPLASFLHLSDMHLGSDFGDSGGAHRSGVRAAIESKGLVMQSHDPQILLLLPLEIRRILERQIQAFKNAWGEDFDEQKFFDRVIVSGDISTDAIGEERFDFAYKYLTSTVPVSKNRMYSDQSRLGLEIRPESLICVPGNHDKMRELNLNRYYSAFSKAPEKCNYVSCIRKYGRVIIFFGLDSNGYNEGNIARGEIDPERLAWLVTTLGGVETAGLTYGEEILSPDDVRSAVRCLVLHHHVVDLNWKRKFTITNPGRRFTILEGAQDLLNIIRN